MSIILIIIKAIFIALFLKTAIEVILNISYAMIMKVAAQKDVDVNGRAAKIIEMVSICITVLFLLRHGYEIAQAQPVF